MKGQRQRRQQHRGPRLLWSAALAVLGAGLLAGCGGQVTGAEPQQTPAAEESPAGSGPVLVTGTVTRDGQPVPDTPVQLQLWPEQENAEVGDAVALKTLGPVTTDQQGRYTFVLGRADVPAEYLVGDHVVNYDVGITDPFLIPVGTSSEYHPRGRVWTEVDGEAADGPKRLDFDLGTMMATEPSGRGPAQRWNLHELGD